MANEGSRASARKIRRRKTSRAGRKNPRGGLTAKGRKAFARREGSQRKPGVRKPREAMTIEEIKRKGSSAVRFDGRQGKLPPLRDEAGRPTRFARTAHAGGEEVARTAAEVRAIATRGRALLVAHAKQRDARTARGRPRSTARTSRSSRHRTDRRASRSAS